MQEEPPAVCHPAVRGHFSWALPQGTRLIGLDWGAIAHVPASHLYSSFIKALRCTETLIQDLPFIVMDLA